MTRALLLAVGIGIAGLVLVLLWVDEGEVVTLTTWDAEGEPHETQLWIVELEGVAYLRAGSRNARWLERARAHPRVELLRGGSRIAYRALPVDDPASRQAVNQAMARKYAGPNRAWAWLYQGHDAIPVRLEPLGAAEEEAPHDAEAARAARP